LLFVSAAVCTCTCNLTGRANPILTTATIRLAEQRRVLIFPLSLPEARAIGVGDCTLLVLVQLWRVPPRRFCLCEFGCPSNSVLSSFSPGRRLHRVVCFLRSDDCGWRQFVSIFTVMPGLSVVGRPHCCWTAVPRHSLADQ
jgi:hypothetical protein